MTKLKMIVRLPSTSRLADNQTKMSPAVEKKSSPKNKKPRLSVKIEMPEGNDRYCWNCHNVNEEANVPCTTCQRSFHEYCAPKDQDLYSLVCPECMAIIRAEKDKLEGTTKGPLSRVDLDLLSELLLLAVQSIRQYALEVFHKPVSLEQYPEYKDYVVKPFDLEQLEQNVIKKKYTCVEQFLADVKWIHHNSVVFNGPQNRISSSALATLKAADMEVDEMSLCPQCYLRWKRHGDKSFDEPCTPPHIIVWAKIRGFPHWPAKVMNVDGDQAIVKFFGDHNKSLVVLSNCTLLTVKPPGTQKSKKGSYCIAKEEIASYIKKYRAKFNSEFRYETEQKKLTREMFESRMHEEFLPPQLPVSSAEENMDVVPEKKEDEDVCKDAAEDCVEPRIDTILISRVPALLAEDEEDKDSGTEEQNSILESIKRKLNLDKKSDSTDEDKEEDKDGAATSPSVNAANDQSDKSAATLPTAESPPPQPLGVDDTPKSPERTNCAEVSSTTADTDPPTIIPKVASGDTFFEKLRQTIEECKEKVGVTELANLPAPNDTYDESETDVSDTELMPYQQKAMASPKKEIDTAETTICKVDCAVQTEKEAVATVDPFDKRQNQEMVAREIALLKQKINIRELITQRTIWQTNTNRTTELIKTKQWCCVCKALATMTCCWNTSYCSQTCQSSHWPQHIRHCERAQQGGEPSSSSSNRNQ